MSLKGSVGILGGAFDPPHNAHIQVALEALRQFELERVILVPNGEPPQKKGATGAAKEDRYQMAALAVQPHDGLDVSRIELDRDGPSYTIDTIRLMKEDYPQGVCFILGADRLAEIETWKESSALLESVPFIVAPRAGISLSLFSEPPYNRGASIYYLVMDEVDLSSTAVRGKIERGETVDGVVPRDVAEYIEERGLYRSGST